MFNGQTHPELERVLIGRAVALIALRIGLSPAEIEKTATVVFMKQVSRNESYRKWLSEYFTRRKVIGMTVTGRFQ